MIGRRPFALVALAAGLASIGLASIGLAGCSGTATTLDQSATQRAVGAVVAERAGVAALSTRCPDPIPRGTGRSVDCKVSLAGGLGYARARVVQADDQGRLTVTVLDAILRDAQVASDLKAHLKASFHRSFQVACGSSSRVVRPGGSFRCRARDADGRRDVLVKVLDRAGTVSYQVLS